MINDFLQWTRDNEYEVEPFLLKEENGYKLFVHDTGILELIPNSPTDKQFVLSCAIHGNETAPIEVINQIISKIISNEITVKHSTLFIFGNPKAMNIAKRFSDENLNRLFAGGLKEKESNYETKRANKIISILENFYMPDTEKSHYDLHTAIRDSKIEKFAMSPFSRTKTLSKTQAALLSDIGIEAIVQGNAPATTFSYHSSSLFDAHSFTLELGKVRPFGENCSTMQGRLERILISLLDDSYQFHSEVSDLKYFTVDHEIIRNKDDFNFSFSEDVANFTSFKKGELISVDAKEEYHSNKDGSSILFPNSKVRIGQRACLIISAKDLPL